MCGIVGYIRVEGSSDNCALNVLKKLEYRGYDSFGWVNESHEQKRFVGAISDIPYAEHLQNAHTTIAHTRWATHGVVSVENAHPHKSNESSIFIVHNGVISNDRNLRVNLEKAGFLFESSTDTEVIANLLESIHFENSSLSPYHVLFEAGKILEGEYAICVLFRSEPTHIYAMKNGSPLVVSCEGSSGAFVSDTFALYDDFSTFAEINDRDVLSLALGDNSVTLDIYNGVEFFTIEKTTSPLPPIDRNYVQTSLGKFDTYMRKEMSEIPQVLCSADRIDTSAFGPYSEKEITITGCGSAYYASMIGHYFRRQLQPTVKTHSVSADEISSLFSLSDVENLLCISQSGETYDTLRPARDVKRNGNSVLSITNRVSSALADISDVCILQNAGLEKCVLSTKSIVSQCAILYKLFGGTFSLQKFASVWSSVFDECFLQDVSDLAFNFKHHDHYFHIGRGVLYPVALENALKLKEVTYCHAEGMGAGFFKHGTLSLIDDRFIVFAHLPSPKNKELYDLTVANIHEIEARRGTVITIGHDSSCDITLPSLDDPLESLLHLGIGQYYAYYLAKELGRNIDQPRSLAKSVTVR